MIGDLKVRCECGEWLVYAETGAVCPRGCGGIVPCDRRSFARNLALAKRAEAIASLPTATKLALIGGWAIDGHPGVWEHSGPCTLESEMRDGYVKARSFNRIAWFTRDTKREEEIAATGLRKE